LFFTQILFIKLLVINSHFPNPKNLAESVFKESFDKYILEKSYSSLFSNKELITFLAIFV
jgi:hypothetical protein